MIMGHSEFDTLVHPPSKTLWIIVQVECTPFVWEKEALILPSPFPCSNGRPPFRPVRHFFFPAPLSPAPTALCCYPVNWALPLEALIKSPNPLIRRKEEGWRETFPCSSLSMCPMALMLAVPLPVVNAVKKLQPPVNHLTFSAWWHEMAIASQDASGSSKERCQFRHWW